jgi:hypothetical protein
VESFHNSPCRAKAEWDAFLPHNMTVSWTIGTKSFCEILTSQIRENGRVSSGHQQLWVESPQYRGQLPDIVYGFLFLTALKCAIEHPEQLVHYIRQDEELVVPENANNAPFRMVDNEWRKFKKASELHQ